MFLVQNQVKQPKSKENSTNMALRYKYTYMYQDRVVKNRVDRALEELYTMGDFDMRIAAKEGLIGAHRVVLMMFSTAMCEILSKIPTDNAHTFYSK